MLYWSSLLSWCVFQSLHPLDPSRLFGWQAANTLNSTGKLWKPAPRSLQGHDSNHSGQRLCHFQRRRAALRLFPSIFKASRVKLHRANWPRQEVWHGNSKENLVNLQNKTNSNHTTNHILHQHRQKKKPFNYIACLPITVKSKKNDQYKNTVSQMLPVRYKAAKQNKTLLQPGRNAAVSSGIKTLVVFPSILQD